MLQRSFTEKKSLHTEADVKLCVISVCDGYTYIPPIGHVSWVTKGPL